MMDCRIQGLMLGLRSHLGCLVGFVRTLGPPTWTRRRQGTSRSWKGHLRRLRTDQLLQDVDYLSRGRRLSGPTLDGTSTVEDSGAERDLRCQDVCDENSAQGHFLVV